MIPPTISSPPVPAVQVVLPAQRWWESQIVGVLAGALVTALISFAGSRISRSRERERARNRVVRGVETLYTECGLAALMIKDDLPQVLSGILKNMRASIEAANFQGDVDLLDNAVIARGIHRWCAELRLNVEAADQLLAVRTSIRGNDVALPPSFIEGVAVIRKGFKDSARKAKHLLYRVTLTGHWWSQRGMRRVRRSFRRAVRARRLTPKA